MSINTQKLLDEIERRYAALDSTSSLSEIQRVSELNTRKDGPILTGGLQYGSLNQANAPSGMGDSAKVGEIFFVADQQLDSSGRFYFRSQEGFINMKTPLDSSENASITAAAAAAAQAAADAGGFSVASINGTAHGYRATRGWPGSYVSNTIDKYSYTSDGNASDVGDLTGNKAFSISSSTKTHGFSVASYPVGVAEKWSHVSDGNSTQIPGLSTPTYFGTGNTSDTYHYITSGYNAFTPSVGNPNINTDVVRAPIANEDAWSDTGLDWSQVTGSNGQGMAAQSYTHGYILSVGGGYPATSTATNKIEKFPFAAEDATSDVGDMTKTRNQKTDNSYKNTYGFSSGGNNPSSSPATVLNEIERISFASDGNGTDIADLSQARVHGAGTNSTTHGYVHGGSTSVSPHPGPAYVNTIDKFPFTSGSNATDVGDLIHTGLYMGGTQV